MKVVWSRRAVEHLGKIREYIEEDDPAAAERVAQRIVYCVRTLTNHPLMGRPGRLRGTRELVITGTPYIAHIECGGIASRSSRCFMDGENGPGPFNAIY